ncbi:MAG: succinylglutamate desuccinylase/aspartoacylase family protein [Spirochaetales bacterium]|nr:succinylglutamate desuccinylase/aspartoacylase family protein [Spirochaetales bacterium]
MSKTIFRIGHEEVGPGESRIVQLRVARLYDHTEMRLPVKVVRGRKDGPRLFVSAALHGDEINGTEIIRRLLRHTALKKLRGTLLAVPVVNVFGFNNQSRYLPDRRDLNRSFPGSIRGSLTARLAHIFLREIVEQSTHGIDLHTGAIHRTNLPQIRASLTHPETAQLAPQFPVPVILNSTAPDGSLRKAALDRNIPYLLFEGGEALRFDEVSIRSALAGIVQVMRAIGMLPERRRPGRRMLKPAIALSSQWIRAPQSGLLRMKKGLGDHVESGEVLGQISDPFEERTVSVRAKETGIIIGHGQIPLVSRGDALFHVATFRDLSTVRDNLDQLDDLYAAPPPEPEAD